MKIEYIIAISKIKGIGAAFFKRNLSKLRELSSISELCSIDKRITHEAVEENLVYAQNIINDCADLGVSYKTIFDSDYPEKLREINDPPAVLYLKGDISLLNNTIVSIIGTRKSSELGNRIAAKIGEYFTRNAVVCNGLVDGIDRWAISNMPSTTCNVVGVISGGLDFEYTSSTVTRELANRVLNNGGLLVSESEPRKKEDQFSGSKASRIQAGLSSAMILVQSSATGGSKYTVKPFVKLDRSLCVIDLKDNNEFDNDEIFGANRLLVNNRISGLAEFCGLKETKYIAINEIIRISTKDDYPKVLRKPSLRSLFD